MKGVPFMYFGHFKISILFKILLWLIVMNLCTSSKIKEKICCGLKRWPHTVSAFVVWFFLKRTLIKPQITWENKEWISWVLCDQDFHYCYLSSYSPLSFQVSHKDEWESSHIYFAIYISPKFAVFLSLFWKR